MRIAGAICEYNPFHLGHAAHLRKTREQARADYVVVCLSGSITQRGEIAILSKAERTRCALLCGADAVFELPALYAIRPAEVFARAGTAILEALGADVVSFGCPADAPLYLDAVARLRERETDAFRARLRTLLGEGMAYPRAWALAAARETGAPERLLSDANFLLGIEYVRALKRMGGRAAPMPVVREGAKHADAALPAEGFASAGAIRRALRCGDRSGAARFVPECVRPLLSGPGLRAPDDLILWRLRTCEPEALSDIVDVSEGFERRVWTLARTAPDLEALLRAAHTRRYTRARTMRFLFNALLQMTRSLERAHPGPEYLRLLGARADAGPLLREIGRRATLPVCTRAADLTGNAAFDLEIRATDLRALLSEDPAGRRAGQDLTHRFVRV